MAGSITVRSSGSGEPGIGLVAAAFQNATGNVVDVTYDDKVAQGYGEHFDVVIASSDALEREFRPAGTVEEGGVSIGRMGLGVTIRPDAPKPDISSVDAFRKSVLVARAFLVTTHTTGLYMENMIRKLGIFEEVQSRIERFPNGPSLMDRLLSGTGVEFAILSTNQIRRYAEKGLVLVGPVPDEMQLYREFVAVPMTASRNKDIARQFVRFCGEAGKPLLVENGFN